MMFPKEKEQEVIDLYVVRHQSAKTIASHFSVSPTTIFRVLKNNNIIARPSTELQPTPYHTVEQLSKMDRVQRKRTKAQDFIRGLLGNAKCHDCLGDKATSFHKELFWVSLQFDHRDPSQKKHDIFKMIRSGRSPSALKKETDKCDIVCANCHIFRTAKMFGSWRLK
jgi:hypothetical protein